MRLSAELLYSAFSCCYEQCDDVHMCPCIDTTYMYRAAVHVRGLSRPWPAS